LADALKEAGMRPTRPASDPPSLADLREEDAKELLVLYRQLGGVQDAPLLRPGAWDLACDDGSVVVEVDEELHFNRYRALTLAASWAKRLPWRNDYLRYCERQEGGCLSAGRWGRRWTNPSCERMFGQAGRAGELDGAGSPRWKQRALYDSLKDLAPASRQAIRVVRVSVYDTLDGHRLWDILDGHVSVSSDAIRDHVQARLASS
jgi:hypothetical protein